MMGKGGRKKEGGGRGRRGGGGRKDYVCGFWALFLFSFFLFRYLSFFFCLPKSQAVFFLNFFFFFVRALYVVL